METCSCATAVKCYDPDCVRSRTEPASRCLESCAGCSVACLAWARWDGRTGVDRCGRSGVTILLAEIVAAKEDRTEMRCCGKHLSSQFWADRGLQCGLSGNRVPGAATPRRGLQTETAVRRRTVACGESQPDLSRKIYSVCCHFFSDECVRQAADAPPKPMEPLNKSAAALSGSFAPTYRFENLEIRKGFLQFPSLNLEQNPSLSALAILSEVPLIPSLFIPEDTIGKTLIGNAFCALYKG